MKTRNWVKIAMASVLTLAAAGLGAPDVIRKELLAGILPGVVRVRA